MAFTALNFHDELQALLVAPDEAASRDVMVAAFRRRGAAGAIFIGSPRDLEGAHSLVGIWGTDLTGALRDTDPVDVARSATNSIPRWFAGWILRRRRPICMSRPLSFAPFAGRRLLARTGTDAAPPLADLVMIPHHSHGRRHLLTIGFLEEVPKSSYDEIVSLGLAYTVKWIGELARSGAGVPRLELSKRELDCLQWLVAGKTLREVATIVGTSYSNVRYHVERAKSRTQLATTQQLIAHAAIEYRLSALGPASDDTAARSA